MRVAGLDDRQVAAVSGKALVLAAHRGGKPFLAQAPHPGSDPGVVEGGVQGDVEYLVEQLETPHVGLRRSQLALDKQRPGPARGGGQGLVEHLDDLIGDAGVGPGQGGQQNGVPALGGHGPQRLGRGAAAHPGQLADPLGGDGRHVDAVRPELPQVAQLGHLGLHGIGRGAGGALVEPRERRHPQLGVVGHQGVELARVELGPQPPVDLLVGGLPGFAHRPQEAVQARAHDALGSEVLKGLGEQQRGVVVLESPGQEPVGQSLALGGPTAVPPCPLDHGGDVEAAEPAVDLGDVAGEGGGGHADALGQPVGHLEGRRGKVGGDKAEEAQRAQLHPQPETARRSPVRAHPAEVADVEGEVLH